jgi:hypothetical protein
VQASKQPQVQVQVTADGTRLVSRAGMALLRKLTVTTGLESVGQKHFLTHIRGADPLAGGGHWPIWR